MIEKRMDLEMALADFLADEVIQEAVRSSGLTPSQFKQQWRDLAARLECLQSE